MGCMNSAEAKYDTQITGIDKIDPGGANADKNLGTAAATPDKSKDGGGTAPKKAVGPSPATKPTRKSQTEEGRFEAWNTMEEAEENTYLAETEDGQGLEEQLRKAFPAQRDKRSAMSDASYWHNLVDGLPEEPSDFELHAPFTGPEGMEQAKAFYRHLLLTDERRRNPKRAEGTPSISRRSVYSLMSAAYELYDRKHAEHGAMQDVTPPSSSDERLLVCGDTHGQLQDVLWIFDEHGEPSPTNAYLFNGDIADRGRDALEILLLLLSYQLADPRCLYINRGNHEQRDLNERPFAQGGGFAWEVRSKYPHDENLIELFQRFFNSLPVAAVVGEWAFVIHGGLFREPNIKLEDVRRINNRRAPPQALKTYDDNLLFDALWADPHQQPGVKVGSTRGAFSATFGPDVTKEFCARNGVKSIVRSHQLPKQRRGFEIQHDSMLLTIFSASNYGGACRNKGGVLIFDEHGPAEVKEFYAPQLDQFRAMVEFRAAEKLKDQIDVWKKIALRGSSQRDERKQDREKQNMMQVGWRHLLLEVNEQGDLSPGDQDVIDSIEAEWKRESEDAEDLDSSRGPPPPMGRGRSVITGSSLSDEVDSKRGGGLASASVGKSKGMRKRQLMTHLMRAADGTTSDRKSSGDVGADKTVVDYTHGVVFGQQTDDDIMHQLLAELCKCKGALITAFIAAAKAEHVKEAPPRQEGPSGPSGQKTVGAIRRGQSQAVALHAVGGPSSASTGSEASLKGEEVSHKVSYETWEATLVAAFPKYAALWKQYGPRLVGAAAYPPLARTGGRPVADCKVAYMQFLDRFQVQIAYETFGSFHQALLGRLYLKLLERTRQMPMKELFAYFDPDHSGGVESTELESALTQLDLGLTKQQLQQLILTLGFENGDEVVEPFQAISLLLERIAPVIRLSAHTAGGLGKRTASKRLGSSNFELAPEKRAALDAKLRTLAGAIQSKMSVVMAAVGSETVQSIFAKADADGSGVLSMEEAVNLMREIQSVVEMDEPVASTPEELEDLVRFIDLDGNGQISFVEFLMAFGTTVAAMSDASLKSKNGLLSAPDGEAKDAIVEGVIRQICSALYERMHLLQRAFNYLDVNGDGWVPVADFEHAITLVMQLPSTPKRKRQEAAAAAAAPAPAPATESEAPSDHGKVEASQIEALVASMRGSALLDDLREPPMIDWTGFIKAFEVIDTDLGH